MEGFTETFPISAFIRTLQFLLTVFLLGSKVLPPRISDVPGPFRRMARSSRGSGRLTRQTLFLAAFQLAREPTRRFVGRRNLRAN